MASLRVLAFDHEGRPVAFDTWHDDLQLYLLSDIKDSVSLFDHMSGVALAPPTIADGLTRSQWLSHDATARLVIRNHLPVAECTHFGQHRTAKALYDAVVARYSSPATAALGRLLLPYLFPELVIVTIGLNVLKTKDRVHRRISAQRLQTLIAFWSQLQMTRFNLDLERQLTASATVADLVTHLRTSDARYRATVPAEFLATNQPPMFITLYFIVSRLPDSLRSVIDHFLSLHPTSLTVDLLDAKHRSSKGKGGRGGGGGSSGGGGGSGSGGGGTSGGGGGSGGGGRGGTGGGSGSSGGGGGGSGGSGGSGGGGSGGGRSGPRRGGPGGGGRSINLQPRVSLPETTPTLRWTGKVGDASAFHVWGSRAFVRDTTADKLSSRAVPCVFLGFPPDAPGWQFYHPTSRRVLSSQDVTFDNSVSYYRLFPYRTASPPPPPLFLAPDPVEPVEVAVDSGAARGACTAGAGPGGAETGGAESGGAEPRGVL
ncbi:unnamed protein product [Closterium sp. NIES-53]